MPKCARCGDAEYRLDGYCTVYCADMDEVEHDLAEARREAEALRDFAGMLPGDRVFPWEARRAKAGRPGT